MKVTHVITGLNDGGAEAVLYRLCTNATDVTHHVVSLMDEGKYGPLLRKAGVAVSCMNMPQGRVTLRGLWRLWRLLRRQRPDVVQTWMYHADLIGGVMARLAAVRRIYWGVHNSNLDRGVAKRSTIWVMKACAWLSGLVPTRIACCAQLALEVHRQQGYAAHKLVVIPNGYDLSLFAPDEVTRAQLRAEWGVDERWTLGMVGRFEPPKDHRTLLEALALLRQRQVDFAAVLVGHGLDHDNIELGTWLRTLGLVEHVKLLGQRSDVPAVMNALDVHVLCSMREAFPNVVAEAMACGTPTVVTDVGDAATIVANTGWVVPRKNAMALAAALDAARSAWQDTSGWPLRQQAARQRVVDNYSLDRMVERYRQLWMAS